MSLRLADIEQRPKSILAPTNFIGAATTQGPGKCLHLIHSISIFCRLNNFLDGECLRFNDAAYIKVALMREDGKGTRKHLGSLALILN